MDTTLVTIRGTLQDNLQTKQIISDKVALPSLAVPGPGRPLSSVTEPLATSLRSAATLIAANLSTNAIANYEDRFGVRDQSLSHHTVTQNHIAWVIVAMWAVARLRNLEQAEITLRDAEEWFFRKSVSGSELWRTIELDVRHQAELLLSEIDVTALDDLLPYALDHHGPGSRRDVLRNSANSISRDLKRRTGVYYTPADVADYMVSWVLQDGAVSVLDPACGTGVFLLATARYMINEGIQPEDITAKLYGIDVDPIAIDLACFVITDLLVQYEAILSPAKLWHLIRLNLVACDTLELAKNKNSFTMLEEIQAIEERRMLLRLNITSRSETLPTKQTITSSSLARSIDLLFPEVKNGFGAVVANPPYAQLGQRKDLKQLAKHFIVLSGVNVSPSTNAFILFMETMWSFAKDNSRSAMIVPMAIAYNSGGCYYALRRAFSIVGGTWTFRFFDRTPDAIFGDDIKQRVAIVLRQKQHEDSLQIKTSRIHRWTSRNRSKLFTTLPNTISLHTTNISKSIPKLSETWEQELYDRLSHAENSLSYWLNQVVIPTQKKETYVGVGTTAYNWFVLYRDLNQEIELTSHICFEAESTVIADWAYGVLASRLTYWLWRVEGDGFHVPVSFIKRLPFAWIPQSEIHLRIATVGQQLWQRAQSQTVNSVNKGVRTRSYSTLGLPELDIIDTLLLESLNLHPQLQNKLQEFVDHTIRVGR